MIQFNLLPDVKQEFIKARRTKRLVAIISFLASAVAVLILLLSVVTVYVVQKKSLHDLDSDINRYSAQVKDTPDLSQMLTVQNQLSTLTSLHDQGAVTSRLFGYISQVTPNDASISNLSVDFTANTLTVTGEAPSLDVVNAYTVILKNTKYTTDSDNQPTNAFSQVVLSSFGRDSKGATYTITCDFDPTIFSATVKITGGQLIVPSQTTGAQAILFQKEAAS